MSDFASAVAVMILRPLPLDHPCLVSLLSGHASHAMPARETVSLLSTGAASAAHSTQQSTASSISLSMWLDLLGWACFVPAAVVLVIVLVQDQKRKEG